jgi:hypothetical protein
MTVATTQSDFEKLIAIRLAEAASLLASGDWDGAYYLVGYAVEFALKVRILSQLASSRVFPDKKLVDQFYKHDLTILRTAARLEDAMNQDPAVSPHWDIVKDWSEQSRYEIGKREQDARELYDAIDKEVLPWIKARW